MPEMGWSGKRDADLLRPAARDLDAFLTVDRRLPREYELSTFRIAVIVLVARSNRLWTWRVPIAEGAEPIPVRTELEVGPELAFKYPVDDGARFMVRQIRDAAPSPDGTTLAFAALDRLYVRPLPDGEPRGLTDLDLVEAQPAWSPDGAWIAFVTWSPDGGHLYKAPADGSAPPVRLSTRPTVFQHPAWSPDGERLVAIQGPARSFRDDALRVATALGAEAIGLDGDLGSIEPGKLADLVVLEDDPIDDIRNTNRIRYVMKNGRLYDADTLDERWPRERPLGQPVWLGDEPDGVADGIR